LDKGNLKMDNLKLNVLYNEDCIDGMDSKIPSGSIDLIITDPPFAIDFKAKKGNYNRICLLSRIFV